ncbi:MAG: magnesium transporter, partial [Planctomycetes bacterium]|nr:magnesium transporter [Planctomycetota bacterium]
MRLPLGPELRDLLGEGEEGHHKLRELLDEYHPKEAAEILNCLEPDEITQAMSLLPIQMERDMFAYFEPSLQEQIMLGSSRSRVQALLAGLPSDERAEFLEGLDDTVRQQLMPLLAREARSDLMRRDRFGDEQVGSIMSTEFCVLSEELTMPRALEDLRRQAPSKETIYYRYAG